jgi:GH15 family glucan-1,4-alpha-glucosidase
MLETDPSFRPVRVREGYPPLEDLGLIGDGATVALVGLDGSIQWLCLPRFDSEPVFCGLLDRDRGGHFTITPDELTEARQRYEPDTGVLVTELRSPAGVVRLTDALALRSGADLTDDVPGGRGELVQSGAFVLCSFWLADNLAMQGRLDEAGELYTSLCARASPLGLLSEQIDPSTGEFIGNFPQAFSHIGVIASGVTLARALAAAGGQASTEGASA